MSKETNDNVENVEKKEDGGGSGSAEKKVRKIADTFTSSLQTVKEDLTKTEKSLKTQITVKGVILVIILIYMTWLSGALKQIDAEAVIATSTDQFLAELPQHRVQLVKDLKAQAPEAVEGLKKSSIEAIPQIRMDLQTQLMGEVKGLTDEMSKDVSTVIAKAVEERAEQVKKEHAGKSEKEQAKVLFKIIRNEYKLTALRAVTHTIDEYSSDLGKLHKEIIALKNAKKLNEKQKLQKKMIQAWVKIMKAHSTRINEAVPEEMKE